MLETSENLNIQAIELASQGCYKEAIACLKRALVIDKKNYLLWYNLGITYRDSGHPKDAKNALLQAYNLNDIDEELLETLSLVCFSLNEIDEAYWSKDSKSFAYKTNNKVYIRNTEDLMLTDIVAISILSTSFR